jgi:tetraacyldisaccharide 4'-kinase
MKAPAFWDSRNRWSAMLMPLSLLYGKMSAFYYRLHTPVRVDIPVICIGNLTAGGAGKTPVALTIGAMLKAKGINAFYVSRGYGGQRTEPLLVNPSVHDAYEVGDEPLLLAQCLPTIVARHRGNGALLAQKRGAKAIIMDDGFQNPTLHKDLSLLVIDGVYGIGNGLMIPAGPLRELPEEAFKRAHGIVIVNPQETLPVTPPDNLPLLKAHTKAANPLTALNGQNVLAFCGIARPKKFFTLLESLGVTIAQRLVFADHHAYSATDIQQLQNSALPLVTTAKDAVRLPPSLHSKLHILDISLEFEDKPSLDTLISRLF